MKVALYARVSSERQAEKDLSIASQLKAMKEFAAKKGWDVAAEFIDEAESARTADRPAFQEMVGQSKLTPKRFDAILVWNLSRFARNRHDSILYKWELRKRSVQIISINEQVDDSPAGKLLEGVLESVNEFYSELLAQDTIRGMKENAERGFWNGGFIPIGYKVALVADGRNERKRLEIDERFAPLVRRIFKAALEGMGAKEIAKQLNREGIETQIGRPWNKTSVIWVLKNELYTGTYVWGKQRDGDGARGYRVRRENTHPAIVEQETFDKVQKMMVQRSPKVMNPKRVSSRYLLSGLLTCGQCGRAMHGAAAKGRQHLYFYYLCQGKDKQGQDGCSSRAIPKDAVENLVIEALKDAVLTDVNMLKPIEMVREEASDYRSRFEAELTAVDAQLDGLKKRQAKLFDALETSKLTIDMVAPRLKELREQIAQIERDRLKAEAKMQQLADRMELPDEGYIRECIGSFRDLMRQGSLFRKKAFMKTFISNVTVNSDNVLLDYTIPLTDGAGFSPRTAWLLGLDSNQQPTG